MEWTEVHRVETSRPSPPAPNGSSVGGTDYYRATYERATWPQDGSIYAGITYERHKVWIGPSADYMHVQIHMCEYPADRSPLADSIARAESKR